METKKGKMAVKENENKLEQGAFLPQFNTSHFADDIFRKWYFLSWIGTALTVVYVEGNRFICDLFILSFECNDGEMCQYHDLRCESLGKYEGKHPLYRLMREWYAYESIQKNSKRHRLELISSSHFVRINCCLYIAFCIFKLGKAVFWITLTKTRNVCISLHTLFMFGRHI